MLARALVLPVLAAALAGCATSSVPTWSSVDANARNVRIGHYSVELPAGWMELMNDQGERCTISRDGTNLQAIEIVRAKAEAAFPNLKRGAPAGGQIAEIADLEIADMKAGQGWADLKVAKNEPITIAGMTGYSLHVQLKNTKGLRYERLVVGFVAPDGYYRLSFQATTLHYFRRDRAAFDALLLSLRTL